MTTGTSGTTLGPRKSPLGPRDYLWGQHREQNYLGDDHWKSATAEITTMTTETRTVTTFDNKKHYQARITIETGTPTTRF